MCALGASMRVVIGVIRAHSVVAELLEDSSHIRLMVDVIHSRGLSCYSCQVNEPGRLVHELARLPGIIWSLAGDQDAGSFVQEHLGCVFQIFREREDGLRLAVIDRLARLVTLSGTVGTAIIVAERAAVIVAEFDDHIVPFLNHRRDFVEAALARERASATAANGVIGDVDAD